MDPSSSCCIQQLVPGSHDLWVPVGMPSPEPATSVQLLVLRPLGTHISTCSMDPSGNSPSMQGLSSFWHLHPLVSQPAAHLQMSLVQIHDLSTTKQQWQSFQKLPQVPWSPQQPSCKLLFLQYLDLQPFLQLSPKPLILFTSQCSLMLATDHTLTHKQTYTHNVYVSISNCCHNKFIGPYDT